MDDTREDGGEPFVTLKNGPLDGIVIPQNAKGCIVDGPIRRPRAVLSMLSSEGWQRSANCRIRGIQTVTAHSWKLCARRRVSRIDAYHRS